MGSAAIYPIEISYIYVRETLVTETVNLSDRIYVTYIET